jgi:hypothetical protein
MAIDMGGNVFVATLSGVRVYDPEGNPWGTIEIPDSRVPANCAFGGNDARTLYITARGALYEVSLVHPVDPDWALPRKTSPPAPSPSATPGPQPSSLPTANIGRGWGLPEKQIRVVADREAIALGKFTVTPIESRHFQFPDPEMAARALGDPEIDAPLTPPVTAFDYRVGKAYALHVAHPKGTWLILGSAGFVEGALEGYDAEVVFLGVGALGSQTDAYRESYWKETVDRANPTRVIPIHWDSLTGPAEGPFTGMVRAAALLSKGSDNLLPFLQAKQAANPNIDFVTLPRYAALVLF